MKACNTDMYHFLRVVAGVDKSFAVLSRRGHAVSTSYCAGAKAGIVVTATLLPRIWRRIYDRATSGKTSEALKLHVSYAADGHGVRGNEPGADEVGDGSDRRRSADGVGALVAPAAELQKRLRAKSTTPHRCRNSLSGSRDFSRAGLIADYVSSPERLSGFAFDYLDLGAENGAALKRHRAAYERSFFNARSERRDDDRLERHGTRQTTEHARSSLDHRLETVFTGHAPRRFWRRPRIEPAFRSCCLPRRLRCSRMCAPLPTASSGSQLYVSRIRNDRADLIKRARARLFNADADSRYASAWQARSRCRNSFKMPFE